MLNSSHKAKRDLLTKMSSIRNIDWGPVVQRNYAYGKLGRPISRTQTYLQQKFAQEIPSTITDALNSPELLSERRPMTYAYDNIGNRITAQEDAEHITYAANNLNQYTQIDTDGTAFVPEYDEDGNQTRVRTVTGIWKVQYNAQNRATRYESEADSTHVITCVYDTQGRRVEKKEEKEGAAISHVRYVYRGYLQVAAYDLLAEGLPSLWQIIWDPTQEIATRPLAIRKDGSFLTYGWDLTKNICETYAGATGFLMHRYAYSPYGLVSIEGDTSYQPLQWSSEVYDAELGLVYYNYRYYNPLDGRWTRRDIFQANYWYSPYHFSANQPIKMVDLLGTIITPDVGYNYTRSLIEDFTKIANQEYTADPQDGYRACEKYTQIESTPCLGDNGEEEDTYPIEAKEVCDGFITMYTKNGKLRNAVLCVAECLTEAEKSNGAHRCCNKRSAMRLVSHFSCYIQCGFFMDLSKEGCGVPKNGLDVGFNSLISGTLDYLFEWI